MVTEPGEKEKATLLIVALLLVLLVAAAPSPSPAPEPSPSPRPAAERQTEQPKGADEQPNTNAHPTEPIPTIVSPSPTPALKCVTDDHGKQGNGKQPWYRTTDGLLTLFNGLLAVFTLLLVIVGGIQARRLRQTVEATKKAADATACALRLNAAAKIKILLGAAHVEEQPFRIHFTVVNTGRTSARIKEQKFSARFKLRLFPFTPDPPHDDASAVTPLPEVLARLAHVESAVTARHLSPVPPGLEVAGRPICEQSEWQHWLDGDLHLLFIGTVVYVDELGHQHITAICEALKRPTRGIFFKPDDLPASYNYET